MYLNSKAAAFELKVTRQTLSKYVNKDKLLNKVYKKIP